MIDHSNEQLKTVFEDTYDQFKAMFSKGRKDRETLISFFKSTISTLESKENIIDKLFFNKGSTKQGEPRFNNLDMSELTIMATIFAEEKQTAKQIFLFFNNLNSLKQGYDDEVIGGLIKEGKGILEKLGGLNMDFEVNKE